MGVFLFFSCSIASICLTGRMQQRGTQRSGASFIKPSVEQVLNCVLSVRNLVLSVHIQAHLHTNTPPKMPYMINHIPLEVIFVRFHLFLVSSITDCFFSPC